MTESRPSLNLHECARIQAPDLAFCSDVVLHGPSGMAYVACDPARLWHDPMRGTWEDVPHEYKGKAGVWAWDTRTSDAKNTDGAVPTKLEVVDFPHRGQFHPLALAVANADPHWENATNPERLVLLLTSQPERGKASVVDVLVHDLRPRQDPAYEQDGGQSSAPPSPREVSATLQHHLRLASEHFVPDSEKKPLSPYRLALFREQYSPLLPSQHAHVAERADARLVAIPSFFFSALPDPTSFDAAVSGEHFASGSSSYLDFVQRLLRPGRYAAPRRGIWMYNARAAMTAEVLSTVPTWPGFAPSVHAWDGGGAKAGFNSTAAVLFTLSTGAEETAVHEWEQHWVRGIEAGLAWVRDPYQAYKDALEGIPSEEESGIAPPVRQVATYLPSFVNFWSRRPARPASALGVDDWGRFWTAGSSSSIELDRWVRALRARLAHGTHTHTPVPDVPRPGTTVEQVTYVWRQGGQVAHPWEYERMKAVRDRGLLIPKEHVPASVFRSRPAMAAAWAPLSIETATGHEMGFLPTAPEGLAVDRQKGVIYIAGTYDERGIARCHIPPDWAER